jgi:hypothetical protein
MLTYFNSFKNLKEYLENDKDVGQLDRTGFNYVRPVYADSS